MKGASLGFLQPTDRDEPSEPIEVFNVDVDLNAVGLKFHQTRAPLRKAGRRYLLPGAASEIVLLVMVVLASLDMTRIGVLLLHTE